MPVVTALRAERRGRVAVELDGKPWRVVPEEAVLRVGLGVGRELDRASARELRRELVRLHALGTATRALRASDVSAARLRERLAGSGVVPDARERTITTLASAGFVDDVRFAENRAAGLAARGYGDAAVEADLVRQGIEEAVCGAAVGKLEPELERARRIIERRGRTARTARYLHARGFGEEALELVAGADFANDV